MDNYSPKEKDAKKAPYNEELGTTNNYTVSVSISFDINIKNSVKTDTKNIRKNIKKEIYLSSFNSYPNFNIDELEIIPE